MNEEEELKLLYLLSGCNEFLPPSYVKLRSYLNIYLSDVADQYNLKLPKSFRNRNKACLFCYSPWSSETTSLKLLPTKKFNFSQAINKNEEKLKKFQINESRNRLVLKCKICRKKSCFSLLKKKTVKEVPTEMVSWTKKKKKKKDKLCGLSMNLQKSDKSFSGNLTLKKKKRKENAEKTPPAERMFQHNCSRSQSNLLVPSNQSQPKLVSGQKLVLNPFAVEIGDKVRFSRKNDKKLKRLKQAVKEEKSVTKKTLKDFLTLI